MKHAIVKDWVNFKYEIVDTVEFLLSASYNDIASLLDLVTSKEYIDRYGAIDDYDFDLLSTALKYYDEVYDK